jgi:hypothetical protein
MVKGFSVCAGVHLGSSHNGTRESYICQRGARMYMTTFTTVPHMCSSKALSQGSLTLFVYPGAYANSLKNARFEKTM